MPPEPAATPTTIELPGAGGIGLRADVYGDGGDPVVLLHGGGQTRHSWRATAARLGAGGRRAYAVDQRGHGDSDWSEDYSIDAFAADVCSIAAAVGGGGAAGRPVLVGASLGGVASLVAEGESDGVARALVLVDVAPRVERSGVERIMRFMLDRREEGFASLEEAADAIARYNPHRPRPRDLSGLEKNLRRRADGRWVWHWDPRFMDPDRVRGAAAASGGPAPETRVVASARLEDAARRVEVPVLLVRGRESDLLSEEGARELLALVPQAEMVDVAGAGHMIAGDRNDVFNTGILEFLDRHAP